MDMERFFSYLLPYLLKGVPVTISVTLIALVFGGAVGLLMAVFRVYGNSAIRKALTIYSTVFRAVPQLVLLLLLYFSIAGSINISAYWAAALSLAVISSAYQLEIFRGTFQSIDPGQIEGAKAIGMSRQKAICKILIPQAVRKAIPAWTNEMATTIKSSSLVYVLGVPEMLRLAQYDIARTKQPFPAYLAVGILYFLLIFLSGKGMRMLEKKLSIAEN